MPDREQILTGLTTAANHYVALAVAWHAVTLVAIIALAAGWRPSRRLAGSLLAAPLISVSAVAWVSGNPFNGAVFAAASLALIVLAAACTSRERVSLAPRGSQLVGAALVAFGWAYPHFLVGRPALDYLIAAPLGVIPCPTLSAVAGAALMARGLESRAWCGTLAAFAGFYAVFGMARLGVWIDVGLLVGAVSLAATTWLVRSGEAKPPLHQTE